MASGGDICNGDNAGSFLKISPVVREDDAGHCRGGRREPVRVEHLRNSLIPELIKGTLEGFCGTLDIGLDQQAQFNLFLIIELAEDIIQSSITHVMDRTETISSNSAKIEAIDAIEAQAALELTKVGLKIISMELRMRLIES